MLERSQAEAMPRAMENDHPLPVRTNLIMVGKFLPDPKWDQFE